MEDVKYYFPSNGTEGDCFTSKWCENCRKDTSLRSVTGKTFCSILTRSLVKGGPIKQWIYKDGKATCTSFVDYMTYKKKLSRPVKNDLSLFNPEEQSPEEHSPEAILGDPDEEVFDPEGLNQYRITGEAYMIDVETDACGNCYSDADPGL